MTLDEIDQKLSELNQDISKQTQDLEISSFDTGKVSWWSTTNAMTMSATVLAFGLIVIFLATYLIRHGKNTEAVLRIFGTILIVVVAVFLVVAGYSDTQIAPVMGLLGTIVGYLLGKETKEYLEPSNKKEK